MKFKFSDLAKRVITGVILGALFGVLCTFFASTQNPDIWGTPLMWSILFNRFLIGFVIGIAGFINYHPCLGFRIYPVFRGAFLGALVSLDSALGIFIAPEIAIAGSQMSISTVFLSSIIAGAIYGMIIDLIVSKFFGEGEKLIMNKCNNR